MPSTYYRYDPCEFWSPFPIKKEGYHSLGPLDSMAALTYGTLAKTVDESEGITHLLIHDSTSTYTLSYTVNNYSCMLHVINLLEDRHGLKEISNEQYQLENFYI